MSRYGGVSSSSVLIREGQYETRSAKVHDWNNLKSCCIVSLGADGLYASTGNAVPQGALMTTTENFDTQDRLQAEKVDYALRGAFWLRSHSTMSGVTAGSLITNDNVGRCVTVGSAGANEQWSAGIALGASQKFKIKDTINYLLGVRDLEEDWFMPVEWLVVNLGVVGDVAIGAKVDSIEVPFDHTDVAGGSIDVFSIVNEQRVNTVYLEIAEVFDDGLEITVGDDTGNDRLMEADKNDPAVISMYSTTPNYLYTADDTVKIYFSASSPTVGSGKIIINIT